MIRFAGCTCNYLSLVRYSKSNIQCVLVPHNRWNSDNANRETDQPVKFSESPAYSWRAANTRKGYVEQPKPWYQPIVVSLSVAVLLLYFCVAREENDIDIELGKTLYDRIEGLEELQLKSTLEYNKKHGLDTSAILERLHQIHRDK